MFDDTKLESFQYYGEYGELILNKLSELYENFTHEELMHRTKCVLCILQLRKPSMESYYMKSYINDTVSIYTKWKAHSELTELNYYVLNDKLYVNKNTLAEISYTECSSTNNEEVLRIISDSFKTLLGYENENKPVSNSRLVIR